MIRLFRVFIPTGQLALLFSEILLITSCFLAATYVAIKPEIKDDMWIFLVDEAGFLRISLVVLSIVLGLHLMDLYSRLQVKSRARLLEELCQVVGVALLAQGLISYAVPPLRVGRGIMLYGSMFTLVTLFLWRIVYSQYMLNVLPGNRILFVGANQVIAEMAEHIMEHPEMGLSIAGYLVNNESEGDGLIGGKNLGRIGAIREVVESIRPDRIVLGLSERRERMPMLDLLELRFAGYRIEEAGTTYETVCGRVCTKELRPSHLIFSGELGPRPGSLLLQNLLNLSVALVGALASLPVMGLVAIAVKLTSSGPVLYRQVRVGQNGVLFTVFKFRSMREDAEAGTGAVWASADDPRVTRFGKFLRRTRLDELPQFFNVLSGQMSLVGPRPERPEFVKTLSEQIPYYRQRHCVKPGITGWAQINHKYGDTIEDTIKKLEYDLYYIKHISPGLDAYIIFQTLKTMVLTRGAQ